MPDELNCELCKDEGLNAGYMHNGVWFEFGICKCAAGRKLEAEDPEAASKANAQARALGRL